MHMPLLMTLALRPVVGELQDALGFDFHLLF